jgi:hypothetical protein
VPLVCGNTYRYYCQWIEEPHHKRCICFCPERHWVFWFNSEARIHGIGQLPVKQTEHPNGLTKDCFLDLSSVKALLPGEIAGIEDKGPVPEALRIRILDALSSEIDLLPNANRLLALGNLAAFWA